MKDSTGMLVVRNEAFYRSRRSLKEERGEMGIMRWVLRDGVGGGWGSGENGGGVGMMGVFDYKLRGGSVMV